MAKDKHRQGESNVLVAERPSAPIAGKPVMQSNFIVDFLNHMTAEEEASLRYAAERDRETANDPDPDALPTPIEAD